jgi:hypothetical protein
VSARVGAGGKSQKIDFIGGLARADLPDCVGKPVEECTVVSGNGLRVVLMGDSHARMWIPAFKAIAKDEGWKLSVTALNECPWQRGLRYGQSNEGIRENCLRHQEDWYSRVVPQLKPDIVILTHQAFDEPAYRPLLVLPNGRFGRSSAFSPFRGKVLALTESSVRTLEAVARKVVILEPIVRTPQDFDPLDCLSSGKPIKECAYRIEDTPTRQELFYRSLDDHRRVWDLDFDRLVCPHLPVCDPVLGGIIVKRDGSHLTVDFARSLAPAIATAFRKAGILETP